MNLRLIQSVAVVLTASAITFAAAAQPSEADMRKDLAHPVIKEIRFSKKPASKQWNSSDLQYYWVKGAVIVQDAKVKEFPKAVVEVGGEVRYTIIENTFTYKEFKVAWNEYKGIPTPDLNQLGELINSKLPDFVGGTRYLNEIVSDITDIGLAEPPLWEWHTANSFSVNLVATYDWREGVYEPKKIDRLKHTFRVRFYREEPTKPFDKFNSSTKGQPEVIKSTEMPTDKILAMQSLGMRDATAAARGSASDLPEIEVPTFATDMELFIYTHKMLREATREELHAYLLKAIWPGYFVENQYPLLNQQGKELVTKTLETAHDLKMTYAQQYGPDPVLKHYQHGMIQFFNELKPIHPTTARITGTLVGGKMVNGKRAGQEWKINHLEFYVSTKPEHIEYLESFTNPEALYALHEGQKTISMVQQGQRGPQTAGPAPAPRQTATTGTTSQPPAAQPQPQPKAPAWQAHTWDEAKFTVELPTAEPKKSNDMIAEKYPRYIMQAEHKGGLIRITAIDYGAELNKAQAVQVVEGMAKQFIDANQARQRGGSDWGPGIYGRALKITKPGVEIAYAGTVKGSVFYEVLISATQGQMDKSAKTRIFNSLKPAE